MLRENGNPLTETPRLFPNPAQEIVTLHYHAETDDLATATIFNMVGEKVLTQDFDQSVGSNLLTLDVAGLSAGSYLVRVENAAGVFVERFVKR